jgi:ferredoxin
MKAIIEEGCIACGLCEKVCPGIFVINDIAEIKPDADFEANAVALQDAIDCCPIEIIKVTN